MQKRALVAGASGYLGRYVVRELKKRGWWVRALVRESSIKKLDAVGKFLEPSVTDMIDDLFVGEATQKNTLTNAFKGIDAVFSSLGITRQRGPASFMDVDYGANKNLLELSVTHGASKFLYVSAFGIERFADLEIGRSKLMFIKELANSGINYTIVEPTGYFSDASEFLRQAMRGRVYLVGDGSNKTNPIHGADLAKVCADMLDPDRKETKLQVGGPQVMSYKEMARIAFEAVEKPARITHIPPLLAKLVVGLLRPLSKRYYTLASFFTRAMQTDLVAPATGTHKLKDHYRALVYWWQNQLSNGNLNSDVQK